ncbi:MAG: membrane protein insertase YidC, partial [Parachlamydiaceae bacterium]|nr:membrane protein insertase YidC [Parachlamydiaceae bacterium]
SQTIETAAPKGDAILLMKTDVGYLPVGIYNRTEKHVTYLEDVPELDVRLQDSKESSKPIAVAKGGQKFYVLENEYQQLVFSNVGGALVEINLPFSSETNKVSSVRPIEFDTDMKANHPYNALFPSHSFFTPGAQPSGPFEENEKGHLGGYYPLIRRDLIEDGQRKSVNVNPRFYALNLLSEYPEFAELQYTVKQFDKNSITFEGQQRQRKITKIFTLPEINAPYTFDLKITVEGDKRGLWLSSGIPEVELFSGTPDPVLKYRITRNQKPAVETIPLPENTLTNSSVNPDWICNSNGFFGIIIDPLTPIEAGYRAVQVPGLTAPSRIVEVDQNHDRFEAKNFPGYLIMSPLKSSGNTTDYRIFAGPFSGSVLRQVDSIYSDPATGYNPDYIACQSYHGWFSFISEPFAKLLFILMNFFHTITGSWALSIILLTAALRIMLYPLNAWSTRSMLRMQQIAPMVTAIQEKYKKDPKKLQMETMNLYREQKVNPMSGCVPMLIQMPFLIGMFDLLKTTFELRGASFIPGWIDNLTSPDVLFSWETPIFFIGNQFHLLPILLGMVMFFQQRMSAPKIAPEQMTDQQRQQRAMGTLMPVIFAFMFYNFPSGLNIYWLSSMLLAMAQQWWMQSRMSKNIEVIAPVTPPQQRKS